MTSRPIPQELVEILRRATELELVAPNTSRWHDVIRANSRLMLAAANAGWRVTEIAEAMNLTRHAASRRINLARAAGPAGLVDALVDFWRRDGLLPNTCWLNRAQALYARSDLQLVLATRHTGRGVDYAAVRRQIADKCTATAD